MPDKPIWRYLQDFLEALEEHPVVKEFFATLDGKTSSRSITVSKRPRNLRLELIECEKFWTS